jgi:hypothetical protein
MENMGIGTAIDKHQTAYAAPSADGLPPPVVD